MTKYIMRYYIKIQDDEGFESIIDKYSVMSISRFPTDSNLIEVRFKNSNNGRIVLKYDNKDNADKSFRMFKSEFGIVIQEVLEKIRNDR